MYCSIERWKMCCSIERWKMCCSIERWKMCCNIEVLKGGIDKEKWFWKVFIWRIGGNCLFLFVANSLLPEIGKARIKWKKLIKYKDFIFWDMWKEYCWEDKLAGLKLRGGATGHVPHPVRSNLRWNKWFFTFFYQMSASVR